MVTTANFDTSSVWNDLEVSGKSLATLDPWATDWRYTIIDELHREAINYDVSLSVKVTESTGKMYCYLRRNRG